MYIDHQCVYFIEYDYDSKLKEITGIIGQIAHTRGTGRTAFNEILCQVKERHFQNIPDT